MPNYELFFNKLIPRNEFNEIIIASYEYISMLISKICYYYYKFYYFESTALVLKNENQVTTILQRIELSAKQVAKVGLSFNKYWKNTFLFDYLE